MPKEFFVLRGGSWINNQNYTHSSVRDKDDPYYRYDSIGFLIIKYNNNNNNTKILRGGCWKRKCNMLDRNAENKNERFNFMGFRVLKQ